MKILFSKYVFENIFVPSLIFNLHISTELAVVPPSVSLSVCLSVPLVHCIQAAEDTIKHYSWGGSTINLYFWTQAQLSNSKGHGRRKRGVCRGSDTPTIYVGDIDMYTHIYHTPYKYSHLVTDRRLRLFGHIARSSPQGDHHHAVAAVIRGLPPDWKRPSGRPSHTWLRAVEADLGQQNIGLASA